MSTYTQQLNRTLKQQFKMAGYTYQTIATHLDLSEVSIKRILNTGSFSLEQLEKIADLLSCSMVDLFRRVEDSIPLLQELSYAQEKELIADERLLLVAICAVNQWTYEEIISMYTFTEAECTQHLLRLDKIGLLKLYPNNRFVLLMDRNFAWIHNGPIWQFFMQRSIQEFLELHPFKKREDTLEFVFGMLTPEAITQLHMELQKVRYKMSALHQQSLQAPLTQRHTYSLLMVARHWEPSMVNALRRKKEKKESLAD